MKKYIVIDKEDMGFMGWTHDKPQTRQSIRSYLYSMSNDGKTSDDDKWEWNAYSLDEALIDYNIELEEAE